MDRVKRHFCVYRSTLDAGKGPWSRSHHETLPLRGHQDEAFREDRVPGRFPGGTGKRLPHADEPPLDVFRRLSEWRRWSRLRPNRCQVD